MDDSNGEFIEIIQNSNTLKTELKCTHDIDLTEKNSIGSLMGFEPAILKKKIWNISEHRIDILPVNSITVLCNLTGGSYKNGKPAHILHQFFPNVPPGFKIVENPRTIIYLPKVMNTIEIIIEIQNQDENPVNFRTEIVTITIHLTSVI